MQASGRANPKTRSRLTLVGRIRFTKHPGEARPKPSGFGTRIRYTQKGRATTMGAKENAEIEFNG